MTYIKKDGKSELHYPPLDKDCCFGCGKSFTSEESLVTYDGCRKTGIGVALTLHASCANAMAQRLIIDTWPNRREWLTGSFD